MRSRGLFFLAALAIVAGVGFAVWRGAGPLPDPEGCVADVGGLTVGLAPDQSRNAALIAAVGVRRGLPARAVSIALATAYQESKIRNLDHGDRDSLGIFQQRPSQGWGTAEQIQDVHYSINRFYEELEKIDGYQEMRITEAAQRVQRSGFPEAYEDHAADARALASALTGYSPDGAFSCVAREPDGRGTAAATAQRLERAYGALDVARSTRQDLAVTTGAGVAGNRLGWSVAQFLIAHAEDLKVHSVAFDGLRWRVGDDSEDGWVRDAGTAPGVVEVSLG